MKRVLVVNFKNYREVLGDGSVKLARAVQKATKGMSVEAIVAPPMPFLALVASTVDVQVFSQTVGGESKDRSTGAVTAEAVRASGARGTILNHSESQISGELIRKLVPRLRGLSLKVCLCAGTVAEASRLAKLGPDYLAVEPPELIGSGIAVSKAKPELVRRTVEAAQAARYKGSVLCGAGIVNGEDVERAVELGVDGVLVSSTVVKAKDWGSKLYELTRSLM
ncbi:MAG: triose-phosphate isomerase [Thaumarchaeota archaeon]|nr:triose-phosphate isomerase [Nitrososphaerota archaeon]